MICHSVLVNIRYDSKYEYDVLRLASTLTKPFEELSRLQLKVSMAIKYSRDKQLSSFQ